MESKKLLLVDDDVTFTQVMARALRRKGFNVLVANDVKSASELMSADIDYAVVDLMVGKSTGLQLLPVLKATNPAMKIVLLTGYASIATAVDAIKLGATQYLAKPTSIDALLTALDYSVPDLTAQPLAEMTSLGQLEWEHIQCALREHAGNVSATARALRMHRRTLQRKLAKPPGSVQIRY